jgi:murein DD-endopeptidase MepM/ murein hydrolase activator NlpD
MSILTHGTEYAKSFQRTPEKVARDIEGLFFQILTKELQRSLPKDSWLGSGPGAQMAGDLFSQAIAQQASGAMDLGLASRLRSQLGLPESSPVIMPAFSGAPGRMPVDGNITSGYGFRRDPIAGDRRFHHGVDIAAKQGRPIVSVSDGVVMFAGHRGGYGRMVRVRTDNGTEFIYAHCRQLSVQPGDRVRSGMNLGEVGSTGRSTGPHLHFEVRYKGASVDPRPWLGTGGKHGYPTE